MKHILTFEEFLNESSSLEKNSIKNLYNRIKGEFPNIKEYDLKKRIEIWLSTDKNLITYTNATGKYIQQDVLDPLMAYIKK